MTEFYMGIDIGSSAGDDKCEGYCGICEAEDELEVGDVVFLVSGGPPLTVVDVCECGSVEVVWFADDEFRGAFLPQAALLYFD